MPLNLDLEGLMYGTELIKRGFAKMQKGGVIMDVTTPKQAITAEEAGAVAVMLRESLQTYALPAELREWLTRKLYRISWMPSPFLSWQNAG